jgi:hypothetical protein
LKKQDNPHTVFEVLILKDFNGASSCPEKRCGSEVGEDSKDYGWRSSYF